MHNATISYRVPGGAQGIPHSSHRVVNYRNKLDKFDKMSGAREHLSVDGAAWDYYDTGLLSRWFPHEIGELRWRLLVNRLPKVYPGNSSLNRLELYIRDFLNELLDGPKGHNTDLREYNPNRTDEEIGDWIIKKPQKIEIVRRGNVDWLHFQLQNYPHRHMIYYFHFFPLNDEFALSVEFTLSNGSVKKYERKIIDETNNKAMSMILDSVKLEFIPVADGI